MAGKQLWYGGHLGSDKDDRCGICAGKEPPLTVSYVRVQNDHLWHDMRLCTDCFNQMDNKLKGDRVYSESVPVGLIPVELYHAMRLKHHTKRAVNMLKYGSVE